METKKQKLNYYYVPKKLRYKLNEIIVPVVPVDIDNDFIIDLLLFNLDDNKKY